MSQEYVQPQFEPQSLSETINQQGVFFDADNIFLRGIYHDELSLFRAKRSWIESLEHHFLLEPKRDFECHLTKNYEDSSFVLTCEFLSACGRYAFWRLIHHQAPEAQYQIETAHIPESAANHGNFIAAPDLSPVNSEPAILKGFDRGQDDERVPLSKWLQEVLQKIGRSL